MMRLKNREKIRGFTLTEVLVSTTIFAVISTIMLFFFIQGSYIWEMLTNESDLRGTGRNAINYMSQELRNATRTSAENPSPNLTIPSKPNNSSLDFYLPKDIDGNGYIIDPLGATEWDKSNKIQYQYVPGQKLLRRLEKGVHRAIANDVTNIEFEDSSINLSLHANELKIILTLSRSLPKNKTAIVTLTSVVKLRNQ